MAPSARDDLPDDEWRCDDDELELRCLLRDDDDELECLCLDEDDDDLWWRSLSLSRDDDDDDVTVLPAGRVALSCAFSPLPLMRSFSLRSARSFSLRSARSLSLSRELLDELLCCLPSLSRWRSLSRLELLCEELLLLTCVRSLSLSRLLLDEDVLSLRLRGKNE